MSFLPRPRSWMSEAEKALSTDENLFVHCRVQFLKCTPISVLNCTSSKPLTSSDGAANIAQAPPKALFCVALFCSPILSHFEPTPRTPFAPCSLSRYFHICMLVQPCSAAPSYDPHKSPHPPTTTLSKRSCLTLANHMRFLARAPPPRFQKSSPRITPSSQRELKPVVRWSKCKCDEQQPCIATASQTKTAGPPAILLLPRILHVSSFSQGAAFPRALGGHDTAGVNTCAALI